MYLVFTHMPGESYGSQLRSLLYFCYIFWVQINSVVCRFFLCILSRLDYCNSLLMGTPNSVIQPMQKVQNTNAHLILRAPRHQDCTPLLQQLHWLPISERIKYKTACISFWAATPLQSFPLFPLIVRHMHAQNPTLQLQNHGIRTFSYFGPHIWNNLPRHQELCYSLFLQKPTHFSSQNISVKPHCSSLLSVCTVCVCVCVHLLHSYTWTLS